MTLKDHLLARISQDGPISVATYMQDCLLHPKWGYYATRDPLGVSGDFVTAPEISQIFGELIGLSLAQAWMDQGQPDQFTLAELGPGRGTLMADLLRATRGIPGFHKAARITLVEASPYLRSVQREKLQNYDPVWSDDVSELPENPLFLVANEFFDALPIHQFVRSKDGWSERRIAEHNGELVFGMTQAVPQQALTHRLDDTQSGDLVELCPAAPVIGGTIAERIAAHGGAALIIDYGDWRSLGDTLQAVRDHETSDVLSAPGQSDLTAHVDFETLAKAAELAGCSHTRLTPQGVFLERLGATARAQSLAKTLKGEALKNLVAAHRRLTHPDEMGNLFKTLGLYPAESLPPPGLEP